MGRAFENRARQLLYQVTHLRGIRLAVLRLRVSGERSRHDCRGVHGDCTVSGPPFKNDLRRESRKAIPASWKNYVENPALAWRQCGCIKCTDFVFHHASGVALRIITPLNRNPMKSYVCSRVFFSLNILPHGPFQTFSPMRVSLLGTEGQLEGVQTEGVFDLNGENHKPSNRDNQQTTAC